MRSRSAIPSVSLSTLTPTTDTNTHSTLWLRVWPLDERDQTQLLVGVTDHALYDEMFSAVDETLSCVIVSTADIQEVIEADRTTASGYVLFEIAAELLTIEYRHLTKQSSSPTTCEPPWHKVRRSCIFDYDEQRKHTGSKMLAPTLCPQCESLLNEAGVAPSIKLAATRIAKAGLAPIRAFLRRLVLNSWFTLLAGFVIGKFDLVWGLVVLASCCLVVVLIERRP